MAEVKMAMALIMNDALTEAAAPVKAIGDVAEMMVSDDILERIGK